MLPLSPSSILLLLLTGSVPGKNPDWHQSYPVIVMEMLNGGDILTHLATKKQLSERHLADIFRSIVISVSTIHKKGFLHRSSLLFLLGPLLIFDPSSSS